MVFLELQVPFARLQAAIGGLQVPITRLQVPVARPQADGVGLMLTVTFLIGSAQSIPGSLKAALCIFNLFIASRRRGHLSVSRRSRQARRHLRFPSGGRS